MFNFSMTHRNSLTTNLTCVSSWCKYTNLSGEEKKKRESRVHPPLSYVTESKLSGKKGHLGQGYPGRNTSWKIVPRVPSTGKKGGLLSLAIAGNLIASLSSRKQPL